MNEPFKVRCLTVKEIEERIPIQTIDLYGMNSCSLDTVEEYEKSVEKNDRWFFVREFNDTNDYRYERYYDIGLSINDDCRMPFTNWIPKDFVVPFSREIKIFEDE